MNNLFHYISKIRHLFLLICLFNMLLFVDRYANDAQEHKKQKYAKQQAINKQLKKNSIPNNRQ